MSSNWEYYYRGAIGRWAELFNITDADKINNKNFKKYLDLISELKVILKDLNDTERKVEQSCPLLRAINVNHHDQKENQTFIDELIIYINSKD